jgi:hypothetical protein
MRRFSMGSRRNALSSYNLKMETLATGIIEIPIGWILSGIGVLCATVGTLATTFYQFMKSRLEAQDKILAMQESQIDTLKAEVHRLSQGCGMETCRWHLGRRP